MAQAYIHGGGSFGVLHYIVLLLGDFVSFRPSSAKDDIWNPMTTNRLALLLVLDSFSRTLT